MQEPPAAYYNLVKRTVERRNEAYVICTKLIRTGLVSVRELAQGSEESAS